MFISLPFISPPAKGGPKLLSDLKHEAARSSLGLSQPSATPLELMLKMLLAGWEWLSQQLVSPGSKGQAKVLRVLYVGRWMEAKIGAAYPGRGKEISLQEFLSWSSDFQACVTRNRAKQGREETLGTTTPSPKRIRAWSRAQGQELPQISGWHLGCS